MYFLLALSLYELVKLHKPVSMSTITKLTMSTSNYSYNIIKGGVQNVRGKAGAPGGLDSRMAQ